MTILIAVLVFGLLVLIHELGHFLVAKKTGVLVEEFSIGMGPALFSYRRGETKYSLRCLPFGGYCAMMSEKKPELPGRSFSEKNVLQRMAIMVAGPGMNLVLAFVILLGLLGASGFYLPRVNRLLDGYSAQKAGMEVGDTILSVDGQRVGIYEDLNLILDTYSGQGSLPVVVRRGSETVTLEITPQKTEDGSRYILGFSPVGKSGVFGKAIEGLERATLGETLRVSVENLVYQIRSTALGLIRVFTFRASADEVAGPVGIVEIIGDSYEAGLQYSPAAALMNVLYLMALLSDNLALVNLIPLPGLDGGHLFFLLIEALRRKPIPPERESLIHLIGLGLVMALMAVFLFHDVMRLLGR